MNIEKMTWVVSGERLILSGTGLDISGGERERGEGMLSWHSYFGGRHMRSCAHRVYVGG